MTRQCPPRQSSRPLFATMNRSIRLLSHFALLLALLTTISACHSQTEEDTEPPPGPVRLTCITPTLGAFTATRSVRGSLQISSEHFAQVAAEVPGRVKSLAVVEGQTVKKGQLIAEIESSPYLDQALANRSAVQSAKVTAAATQDSVLRLEHLQEQGIASRQEVEDARVRAAQANAALAGLEGANKQLMREIGRASVRAPISGALLRVVRGPGELVDGTPATPIVVIGDPRSMQFVGNVTAADLAQIHQGQSADLDFGMGPSIAGVVEQTALAVDPVSGIGTVRLRVASDKALPLGLTGSARVHLRHVELALTLPETALRQRGDDDAEVLLCVGDQVKVQVVTLGATEDGRVEITGGLEKSQQVAADHVVGVEDDAPLARIP